MDLLFNPISWLHIDHFAADGIRQMALDEALLTWLASQPPTLITRSYTWQPHTLSVGKNQSPTSIRAAFQHLCPQPNTPIVRRPTGGRAILHGDDVSFAFITNSPEIRQLSLSDSYCIFAKWVRFALMDLGVPLQEACPPTTSDYTRSALCFETHAIGDLVRADGSKVAGAAQWRTAYGLLQHGAAFIHPEGITAQAFDKALTQQIQASLKTTAKPWVPAECPELMALWQTTLKTYKTDSEAIRAKCVTTSGSHLAPDSD